MKTGVSDGTFETIFDASVFKDVCDELKNLAD